MTKLINVQDIINIIKDREVIVSYFDYDSDDEIAEKAILATKQAIIDTLMSLPEPYREEGEKNV